MSHLKQDSLACLVDGLATPEQERHLAACPDCCRALEGLRAQTRALSALPSIAPPAGAWDAIAARLEAEPSHGRRGGTSVALARAGANIAAFIRGEHLLEERQRRAFRRVVYAAAAVALFFSGGVTQSMLSRSNVAPPESLEGGGLGRAGLETGQVDLVSGSPWSAPANIEDAKIQLRVAELLYQRALVDYSALANPVPPHDVVARLAALEVIVRTTGAALERAPADPVINTYYLAALAERTTLLGQIH
jgi:hypothetical protein